MAHVTIQNSLNSGELAPSVAGRQDLDKWKNGTFTCRNFFVDYRGGVMSRAGLAYVGTCKQPGTDEPPRDIPFQFNNDQGYVLEFGTEYMRVKYRGAYVTESTTTIPAPHFGAIEGFVGASTPVGYDTFPVLLSEDRAVPYLIQMSGSPTTGSPGLKLFGFDDQGSELLQATQAGLGVTGVRTASNKLHPNGNLYFTMGVSNSAVVAIVDAKTLTLKGTFGTASSFLGSDATHFTFSFDMVACVLGSSNHLLSTGIAHAGANNEISFWSCLPTTLAWQANVFTTEPNAFICEGHRGSGEFFALGEVNYLGGLPTPFTLYAGSTASGLTLTAIAAIAPTDVDATWTNISSVQGPGYDDKDGNLLCFVNSPDAVANPHYLVKFDKATGAVLWKTPVPFGQQETQLNKSYFHGILQYFNKPGNNVVTVDLDDGSTTTTAWNNGFTDGAQLFDHALGVIIMNGAYTQSSGPIPVYLGTYLAGHGNVIPAGRPMGIYSTQFLPLGTGETSFGNIITDITTGNPAQVTIFFGDDPAYAVGDWVYFRDVEGQTNWNGRTWIVIANPSANVYEFSDLFGVPVDSSTWPIYTGGGFTQRVFTLTTTYQGTDLPYLKYAQSADVMTLCLVNQATGTEYPPFTLTRHAQDNWTLVQDSFASSISAPTNLTATPQSSTTLSTWYSYVVTAVDAKTGEESVSSNVANVFNNDIAINLGSNLLVWDPIEGAGSYNVYAAPPSYAVESPVSSIFGFIGTALGPSFTDNNTTPDYTFVPPVQFDPFTIGGIENVVPTSAGMNYSQDTIGYTVHTATGSGFLGYPVVANGEFAGFVILDQGHDYQDGDTITFTDSGGGIATGNYSVASNPSDGDTITINGATIEFKDSNNITHPDFQLAIGTTIAFTLQALADRLNGSPNNPNWNTATYTIDATHLFVTFKVHGAQGNTFHLGSAPPGWTASGATLSGGGVDGTGAAATLTVGPQSGTYPSVPAYFQQRRVYANSKNQPDTYWMSQVGFYNNMDSSIPVMDSDSITGTPWAQQVNGIQFLTPMPGGLVTFTGKQAWQVNGGSQAAITPSNQTAVAQAFNGCSAFVPPLPVNYDLLYVQAKGCHARDLSYNFFTNIYTGTDLSILSNHLFDFNTISQWCWCEEPYKLVWTLRNDGTLLCLTYMKEQEVFAWTRHDTNGLFVSVCSITEPPVDALYTITKRYVQGAWRYYSERMNNRLWDNVEASFCVDSGVSYPTPNLVTGLAYFLTLPVQNETSTLNTLIFPSGSLTASASSGVGVTFTASEPIFVVGNVGDVLRMDGGIASITAYVSPTVVTGTITTNFTLVVPNDPLETPLPADEGFWSLSPPETVVTGLWHLEGLEVAILADGSVVDNQVVVNGSVTLDQDASLVTVGLPYTCQLQTVYLEHEDQLGTAQNRRKNISAVGLRVQSTRGITVGADQIDSSTQQNFANVPWTDMTEIQERNCLVSAGASIPLYTGDHYTAVTSSWNVRGQVAIQQTYPLPATILAIIAYWEVGDNR